MHRPGTVLLHERWHLRKSWPDYDTAREAYQAISAFLERCTSDGKCLDPVGEDPLLLQDLLGAVRSLFPKTLWLREEFGGLEGKELLKDLTRAVRDYYKRRQYK